MIEYFLKCELDYINDLDDAVTCAILFISSVFSLIECLDLKYARLAFGLCIAYSSLGLVKFMLSQKKRELVKPVLESFVRLARTFYLPLITVEACVGYASFPLEIEVCFVGSLFAFPCIYMFRTELLKKNVDDNFLGARANFTNIITLIYAIQNNFGVATIWKNCLLFIFTHNYCRFLRCCHDKYFKVLPLGLTNVLAIMFLKR